MIKGETKNIRVINQLDTTVECYFYGYFKSPGLKKYPELNWINDDYNLIKNKNLNQKDCYRIAKNLFDVALKFNILKDIDYVLMMPLKLTSVSSLELIINEFINLVNINLQKNIQFINDIFIVGDYKKFWENKLNIVQRKAEIANKIKLRVEYYHFFDNKKVLLIDDIVSTGITIADVTLLLKNHNTELQIKALCYGSVYHWEKIYS